MSDGPFHPGEIEVQEMAQERAIAERNGAVMGSTIPAGAIPFLAQQRMLVIGTVAPDGLPWASLIFGEAGFAQSDPAGKIIEVTGADGPLTAADVYQSNLESEPRIGVLAIELATRRRLRVNGRVASTDFADLAIEVEEAYPNCPKYIQRRYMGPFPSSGLTEPQQAALSNRLDDEQWGVIQSADTLFVASRNGRAGVDASHRGGPAGFVERAGPSLLRIPDYAGNSIFNTLGNMNATPFAGVTVLDFDTGRILQLAGRATLSFGQPDPRGVTGGTGRFWELEVEAVRDWRLGLEGAWEFLDASPFNPQPRVA